MKRNREQKTSLSIIKRQRKRKRKQLPQVFMYLMDKPLNKLKDLR